MSNEPSPSFSEEQQEALKSIRISRILLPILLGVGVVIYMLLQQFDPEEFARINWTRHTSFWIFASFLLLIVRHLAYAARLRILSERDFSWKKCIELIFIWEFSSAVSPTSVGGSAVALFVLSQEKLPTARVTAIVLYTAVLDTIFFVGTLPILFLFFGSAMIRPNMNSFLEMDAWGYTFLGAYVFMAIYGSLFYYGLFINPEQLKRFFTFITKKGFLKRYHEKAVQLGSDFVLASKEISKKKFSFGCSAFLATAAAWSCRFLLLNCLIIAFITTTSLDFWTQFGLYARLETMFVIMAFSPTPGGAGFAEILFNGFLTDYINEITTSSIIAIIWRVFTYYLYLLIGVIVIPNWIRTLMNKRKKS